MQDLQVTTDKKTIFSWAMYDFANSSFTTLIVTFIYATYFTKAIALDEITGTTLWSRGVTISALAVALLSPYFGAMADISGHRKRYLIISTIIAVLCATLLYFPRPGQTVQALTWFILGNIAFEMGCVFYNAFLPEIAPLDKIGSVSGFGWGLGYLGGLAAMMLAMVTMVNPETPWFGLTRELGQNIRATNLLVAVWFGLFSLPMFLFIKGNPPRGKAGDSVSPGSIFKELAATFREIRKYRQVFRFLLARLIYNDGLITIFAFGGIYAAGTFGFTFQEIMVFGIVLNIAAGLGAFAFGYCDDHLGGKTTILISLIGLIVAAMIALSATDKNYLWLAGVLIGLFSGPNQSAGRSLLARMIPPERETEFFGFFAFSGKFTAFIGPFFLGVLTELFQSQRAGMSIVLLLFLAGTALLLTVDEREGIRAVRQS
ncbi:MAG: MFS transporter [Proteobacteria bacterium]|nr:MFS transporter [Pseudomonadota bacterium]MBU1686765.1 MFS transporter [Pseudomonadota bacterium]